MKKQLYKVNKKVKIKALQSEIKVKTVKNIEKTVKNIEKTTMGNHKETSCNVCFKSMRSNNIFRHMKIHIIHTLENNVKMCHELLDEMLNEVLEPEEFTTKRKFDGEQYTQDDQPSIKRKCGDNMIDDEVLEKMLEEQTVEYDRKVDLGEKVYKILGRGEVKQAALSKDMHGALCLYRHSINNRRNVEIDTDN